VGIFSGSRGRNFNAEAQGREGAKAREVRGNGNFESLTGKCGKSGENAAFD
jgi:hypothetical protein